MQRVLYTYWRSQAAYRVRIALHLKGLHADFADLDLLKGDQFAAHYRALNPEMMVPTLIEEGQRTPLIQSMAILEYLDERYPHPPLFPSGAEARARARAIAYTVAMDVHPFIVPRVRKYLAQELRQDEASREKWVIHWLNEGSNAVEALLASTVRPGAFCCAEEPGIADICLVAHFTSAALFKARDVAHFPIAHQIFDACMAMEAFASTHPLRQVGAEADATV